MELKSQASEAGHWYTIDGVPAYEVIAKGTGLPRATTLRDAKTMNLCPSVTAIINCAAKPGLENWKAQQVLLAALTTSRAENETEDAYVSRILADSKEQMIRARDKGTEIHAALQGFYEGEEFDPQWQGVIESAKHSIDKHFGVNRTWKAEQSFAHYMGYGGKCDLVAVHGLEPIVIDFKTKDFDAEKIKKGLAWEEHAMQLIAYAWGLDVPSARCANVFVSTTQPGLVHIHEWDKAELAKSWAMFRGLLTYWQAKTGYAPNFEMKAA